jgi:hypothetical protein
MKDQKMNIQVSLHPLPEILFSKTRSIVFSISTALVLSGCTSGSNNMSGFGVSGMDWFNSAEPSKEESFVVGTKPSTFKSGNDQEAILHNAIELAQQKRFLEARILLTELREIQHRKSDGYRALSIAMALMALREGDIKTFGRIARQLDASLENPVRVPPAYIEVVSLYRAINGQSLPVNAPERIQQMRDRLLPAETASIKKGSK